jgi:predicted amidohydrolase
MKVCFVSRGTPDSFSGVADGDVDLAVFAFQGGAPISYEKELRGETAVFSKIAEISKRCGVTVCGLQTDARGIKRKSVLVAENGRILGVSDMVNVIDGAWNVGANTRVFQTKKHRLGVVVAEDLYFFEVVKSLALCGCDWLVCPFGGDVGEIERVMLRANAFCFGVPILFCGKGYAMVVGGNGEVAFASPQSPIALKVESFREYHLVETRQRGFSKRKSGDI